MNNVVYIHNTMRKAANRCENLPAFGFFGTTNIEVGVLPNRTSEACIETADVIHIIHSHFFRDGFKD